jgi:hypothetical protein
MIDNETHAVLAWSPNHEPVEFKDRSDALECVMSASRLNRSYALVWTQPRHAKADRGGLVMYEDGRSMITKEAKRVLRIMTTDPTASPQNRCIARTILTDIGEWPPHGEEEQAG